MIHLTISTGEKLTLFMKTSSGLREIWSSTLHNKLNQWVSEDIDLTPTDVDQFTVLFKVRVGGWCKNSVGLDDIRFIPCPIGEYT